MTATLLQNYIDRYLQLLPPNFQDEETSRFLSPFCQILGDIEDKVNRNLTYYLFPETVPREMLPWLASLASLPVWPELEYEQLRRIIPHAPELHRWHGTRYGLFLWMEVYLGIRPKIQEHGSGVVLGKLNRLGEKCLVEDCPLSIDVILEANFQQKGLLEKILQKEVPAHVVFRLIDASQQLNNLSMEVTMEPIKQRDEELNFRPIFHNGQALDSVAMNQVIDYPMNKMELIVSRLWGSGIIKGLDVVAENGKLFILPGEAIDKKGRWISLLSIEEVKLPAKTAPYTLALSYKETVSLEKVDTCDVAKPRYAQGSHSLDFTENLSTYNAEVELASVYPDMSESSPNGITLDLSHRRYIGIQGNIRWGILDLNTVFGIAHDIQHEAGIRACVNHINRETPYCSDYSLIRKLDIEELLDIDILVIAGSSGQEFPPLDSSQRDALKSFLDSGRLIWGQTCRTTMTIRSTGDSFSASLALLASELDSPLELNKELLDQLLHCYYLFPGVPDGLDPQGAFLMSSKGNFILEDRDIICTAGAKPVPGLNRETVRSATEFVTNIAIFTHNSLRKEDANRLISSLENRNTKEKI